MRSISDKTQGPPFRLNSKHIVYHGEKFPFKPDAKANGVTHVDVETVRFLNACEKGGVELLHCWPYIQ